MQVFRFANSAPNPGTTVAMVIRVPSEDANQAVLWPAMGVVSEPDGDGNVTINVHSGADPSDAVQLISWAYFDPLLQDAVDFLTGLSAGDDHHDAEDHGDLNDFAGGAE